MPKKTAIIGLGNILRRDDGIGIMILEALLKFYRKTGIDYLNYGTASFDLIHRIGEFDAVLLIDAIDASLPAGTLKIFELGDISYNLKDPGTSTHEFDLRGIFEMCVKLDLKTKIYVAGIQVKDTSWAEGLTPVLQKKKNEIIKQVNSFIDKIF